MPYQGVLAFKLVPDLQTCRASAGKDPRPCPAPPTTPEEPAGPARPVPADAWSVANEKLTLGLHLSVAHFYLGSVNVIPREPWITF